MSLIHKSFWVILGLGAWLLGAVSAQASGLEALQKFVKDVRSGSAHFTQTVTSPDGKKQKTSSGQFEFARPERFRFAYTKPFEQLIVGDGRKVWIYDADLNQVSARPMAKLLGASPAALLAGGDLDKDFEWKALPAKDGLDWVEAKPKPQKTPAAAATAEDAMGFQTLRVGFKGSQLAAMELLDHFGQRSLLQFDKLTVNAPFAENHFRFTSPPGVDVVEQ
jgi:outer membrane lipoprotein carrier protein